MRNLAGELCTKSALMSSHNMPLEIFKWSQKVQKLREFSSQLKHTNITSVVFPPVDWHQTASQIDQELSDSYAPIVDNLNDDALAFCREFWNFISYEKRIHHMFAKFTDLYREKLEERYHTELVPVSLMPVFTQVSRLSEEDQEEIILFLKTRFGIE